MLCAVYCVHSCYFDVGVAASERLLSQGTRGGDGGGPSGKSLVGSDERAGGRAKRGSDGESKGPLERSWIWACEAECVEIEPHCPTQGFKDVIDAPA